MIIPLLTILISLIALFVNNFITIRNNKLQIEANVITSSRVKWIQDVRDSLVLLNKENSYFRLESSKIARIEYNDDNYKEYEDSYNKSYLNTQSAIQQLRNYFPIKADDLEEYKTYNDKLRKSKITIDFDIAIKESQFSHININYLLDMYEIELDYLHIYYASGNPEYYNKKSYENKFKYDPELQLEYTAIKEISEWVNSYLKNEWDEAKIIKLKENSILDFLNNLFSK
ncbi:MULTISPECIES: hypothetical protein [unclassified Mammaliicoccus]|uniref:hypothetical protein n=1 Tax=unclassified Mammaliicoccus TaxID=2803851 RepID=UPI001EFB8C29|nr:MULTISPECIES: hypothetical protein [unclassified Mammaliicoccus]